MIFESSSSYIFWRDECYGENKLFKFVSIFIANPVVNLEIAILGVIHLISFVFCRVIGEYNMYASPINNVLYL